MGGGGSKYLGFLFNLNLLYLPFAYGQWIIGEQACYTYSMVAVPLYDTLGPEALVFIINQGNWIFFHHGAGNESSTVTGSQGELVRVAFNLLTCLSHLLLLFFLIIIIFT